MKRFTLFLSALALSLHIAVVPTTVFAQNENQETINLFVGDIFEILPSHTFISATYTWILTQDRTFLEAGRAKTFRKRIIQPGSYTLYAEVADAQSDARISRTFTLNYQARQPGTVSPTVEAGSGMTVSALVQTTPASRNERLSLMEGSQLVLLEPLNANVHPLSLDTNTQFDSNGDGDPTTDPEGDQTFFQSDATPLYVWITTQPPRQTIIVSAEVNGVLVAQNIAVTESHGQEEVTNISNGLNVQEGENGSFQFAVGVTNSADEALLYQWQFGDGQQSLLEAPSHTYKENGAYTVQVRVRNLADGTEVARYEQQVVVSSALDVAPEPNEQESEDPVTSESSGGFFANFGTIVLLGGIFLISILVGAGAIYLISRFRRKPTSLSDAIESMENTLLKPEVQEAQTTPTLPINPPEVVAKPAPTTPPPEIAQREKEQALQDTKPTPPPTVNEQNAPAWLKSGLASQPTATQLGKETAPKAPPPAAPTPPAAKKETPAWLMPNANTQQNNPAQPKPQATPPAPVQPKPATAAVPPWMQQETAKKQPTPAPQPKRPAASTPKPKPVQQPKRSPPPAPPKPVPTPQQAPAAKPAEPTPTPQPIPPTEQVIPQQPITQPPIEEPIAFIRAESLDAQDQKKTEKKQEPDNSNQNS